MLNRVLSDITLVLVSIALLYVFTLTYAGMRFARKQDGSLGAQETYGNTSRHSRPSVGAAVAGIYVTYVLIPCLNEERVITATVDSLLSHQSDLHIVVVDDGSDDATAELAEKAGGDHLTVLRRTLPDARKGKGEALNAGLAVIRAEVGRRQLDTRKVLICVMDADGQLTQHAVAEVSALFDDPTVGGAQLVVRIRNRHGVMLTIQDMEFWILSGVTQLGRVSTGTVSMGGNGQFTRLYALDELGERPWSRSLTEDLDLGISLSVRGWRTTSTTRAFVTQQGLTSMRKLLRQRVRWFQGHMMAGKRIGELVRSREVSNLAFFELISYLSVPWLLTLPWSLIQQYVLFRLLTGHGLTTGVFGSGQLSIEIAYGILIYLLSFAPYLFWAYVYWRRTQSVSMVRALLMSHLIIIWTYVSYVAAWRAVGRIVFRRRGWVKTARLVEPAQPSSVPAR